MKSSASVLVQNNNAKKIPTVDKYSQIKLYFAQGVVSSIYSQLLSSIGDFYGVMLGNYKEVKNIKAIDSNANLEELSLNILVYKVIFIFDKTYLSDIKEMQKLFNIVSENEEDHRIIGMKILSK